MTNYDDPIVSMLAQIDAFREVAEREEAMMSGKPDREYLQQFNSYQYEAKAFEHNALHDTYDKMLHAAIGIAGEAGEVADYVKKVIYHGHDLNESELVKELGDVLWYLTSMASAIGVDLSEVAYQNIVKLSERYPHGFSQEDSRNRKEYKKDE